jgi:hypothetical protein
MASFKRPFEVVRASHCIYMSQDPGETSMKSCLCQVIGFLEHAADSCSAGRQIPSVASARRFVGMQYPVRVSPVTLALLTTAFG